MATTSTALSMKLLVDTKAQQVLFAEASKDVVDFLFSLLVLPVGTAAKLLGKDSMVGCVASLYGSVEKLAGPYVQPGVAKDALLNPTVLSAAVSNKSSLLGLGSPSPPFYRCPKQCGCNDRGYSYCTGSSVCQTTMSTRCLGGITHTYGTTCPSCNNKMTKLVTLVSSTESGGQAGFVQGIVDTYRVMDDLDVTPMSSISSIALLNTFAVKDLGALQEKTVQIGYKEGLEILKSSLQSKTVLTDVFIAKKRPSNT